MHLLDWNIEEITGYKPKTTFYTDLSIADKYGKSGILDTYERVFDAWKDDTEFFTEFVMALNWKIWEHHDKGNIEIAKVYNDLWEKAQNYVYNNWNEEQQSYYFRTTD
jgi:hypothetical protein